LLHAPELPGILASGAHVAPHVMQRKAERIAQGRYQYVAGVGHLANMEHPQVFNGAALQFLQRFFPV
ncbi:MAG: alpha/beta hydrolase, partial [Burkholderiaceae bacterium]